MGPRRMKTKTFSVAGMHCGHCEAAVKGELEGISGVETVEIELATKIVTVRGHGIDDTALVAAIDEAGYDAELISS